ncbi:MAG: MYXO-CTERM sorting domain-containing protein [Myxococcota bacterium]
MQRRTVGGAVQRAVVAWAAVLMGMCLGCGAANAHGVLGHVHVTGWAAENLPNGELREFFREPEVFNALLFGAAFADSGFASSIIPIPGIEPEQERKARAYGEHTHWEPFIEDFVTWIQTYDPPPWDTLESRQRVAFLMGCAAHGLQDEVFDTLFLYQVDEHDNQGQSEADPASDGFLGRDAHLRFFPKAWMPMETLLELYADLPEAISEEVIVDSVDILLLYVGEDGFGADIAQGLADIHEPNMPWTRAHYLDPNIPGSLRAEIPPTMRYLQALWKRLHGELGPDEVIISAYPDLPRRLLSGDARSPDSWVSVIFGAGVRYRDLQPSFTDDMGVEVAHDLRNTRWGNSWPRIVRVVPTLTLEAGGWYTVGIEPGAEVINGSTLEQRWSFRFQVECSEDNTDDCEDLGELPAPSLDGPPLTAPGEGDAGLPDTATDTEPLADTANPADIGADATDTRADTEPDPEDTAAADIVPADTVPAEDTARPTDTESDRGSDDGCGCAVGAPTQGPPGVLWVLWGAALLGLKRRRR